MRILHLDAGREMRGGQYQVLFLMRGLRRRGHHQILLARPGSELARRAASENFEVRALSWLGIRRLALDLVHAHDAHSHTLAALATAAPLVVARRVAFHVRSGFLSRWKYARPTRYIAVSRHVKETLIAAGIGENRISIVYDGVPLLDTKPMGDTVLAPASRDPMKGTAIVLDAARLAEMEVRFTTNLQEDLPGARMLVYISHEEGLGSAALLAMSAGVPVLASATGGLPEIVRDGETGLLTSNQPEIVAMRMRRLYEDKPLAECLGKAGREMVAARFSIDAMVAATEQVYLECLS